MSADPKTALKNKGSVDGRTSNIHGSSKGPGSLDH